MGGERSEKAPAPALRLLPSPRPAQPGGLGGPSMARSLRLAALSTCTPDDDAAGGAPHRGQGRRRAVGRRWASVGRRWATASSSSTGCPHGPRPRLGRPRAVHRPTCPTAAHASLRRARAGLRGLAAALPSPRCARGPVGAACAAADGRRGVEPRGGARLRVVGSGASRPAVPRAPAPNGSGPNERSEWTGVVSTLLLPKNHHKTDTITRDKTHKRFSHHG